MARKGKKKGLQNVSKDVTNTFVKGLNKDAEPSYVTSGMWTHAINATNSTVEGDLGTISNESSNYLCGTSGSSMPLTVTDKFIIGSIYLYSDKWVIYTAGHNSAGEPITSEIGLFETDTCTYREIVQDSCLKFDKRYLITGSSREMEDCTWQVYWSDGLNPDRVLNIGDDASWPDSSYQWVGGASATMNYYSNGIIDNLLWPGVKWKQDIDSGSTTAEPCETYENLNQLDCPKIRLARLMKTPCLNLELGQSGGSLANGTYFAMIAYTIKGQRVTDYFSQSNNQIIYDPEDDRGALTLQIEADKENFDEFILVLVQNVNQGTVAKQIGFYSTSQERVTIDIINASLVTIPLETLPIQTPVYETSDQITSANNYLLRIGPKSKFDFNYQPLANQIRAQWASVEYPANYYVKGNDKTNYLRDEVYTFYIRWVYDTGDKSSSYHIPGRAPREVTYKDFNGATQTAFETDTFQVENSLTTDDRVFEVINTASLVNGPLVGTTTDDGGTVLATGDMGYWESTEEYPDDRPDIWNPSQYCWTGQSAQIPAGADLSVTKGAFDLCGEKIRHHKMPENYLNNNPTDSLVHFNPNANSNNQGSQYQIRLLGVFFENIILPKDQEGNDIEGIVGYEILRGSREGNKSIIAKGMVNNFRTYKRAGSANQAITGLYANYPFNCIRPLGSSNNSSDHDYLYNDPYIKNENPSGNVVNQDIPRDLFSFHSPDTTMRNPYLSSSEFKLYGHLSGFTDQQFIEPNGHPKVKLLAGAALIPMFISGIAAAIISLIGKRTQKGFNYTTGSLPPDAIGASAAAYATAASVMQAPITQYNIFMAQYYSSGNAVADAIISAAAGYGATSVSVQDNIFMAAANASSIAGYSSPVTLQQEIEFSDFAYLDPVTRILGAIPQTLFYFSEGADTCLKLMYAFTPFRQFALQQISYGFYSDMTRPSYNDLYRFKLEEGFYIKDNLQEVPTYQTNTGSQISYRINNLKRPDTVVLRTKSGPTFNVTYPDGVTTGPKLLDAADSSLTTLGKVAQNTSSQYLQPGKLPDFKDPDVPFSLPIASHYGAIKSRLRNQYGQLGSVYQIIVTPCEQKLSNFDILDLSYQCPLDNSNISYKLLQRTNLIFGGDTYINRYTEKNSMLFFFDWLFKQPDGFEFNYFLRNMIPNTRFAMNSTRYDSGDLSGIFDINNIGTPGTGASPSNFYNLDYRVNSNRLYDYSDDTRQGSPDKEKGVFSIKQAFFYLSNSGIKDYFVESDVVVDFRQQAVEVKNKHYDPYRYTDYQAMFDQDPNIIGEPSGALYDYSLSSSKLYNQYFSQGSLQNKYYNPSVAKLCYTYYPDRLIYSLPTQDESVKDSWYIYLINNYKAFKSEINSVKSINDSGIFITFKNESPMMYQGVDTLQTDAGTKITIGDGGLFSQPTQNVSASDRSFEYGSCQSRLSIINTPVGLYYMSQDQGKIFAYGGGLTEITNSGMKWWFILFMPYKLTEDFPDYPYQDNPVCGIGCQSIYDNSSNLLYFCKKDYYLRDKYKGRVEYIPLGDKNGDSFMLDGNRNSVFKLGDPLLFEDASWTVSYDPKSKFFISFHDWHPDLNLPTKDYFQSTKKNGLWRHNYLCNSYCNYYGEQHGFEVEIPSITGQNVVTLRSLTYILECYRRNGINCVDQHHVLDYNFDQAVVYNSEQVSGYLNLNIYPKNNINESLKYPKLSDNFNSYDILVSKEEQKYRLNQFWDITKDRAEFPEGSDYPPTGPTIPGTTILQGNYESQNTWVTPQNGYKRVLNAANMNYSKSELQQKKFRHYTNFVTLTRKECNDINMILKIINTKNQISQR